ncbi:MAG TPA: ribosome biogenesis GTPase Der [Gemmatimonadales bacterium]
MSQPTVAIVGRPNVGKSTLFNRLCGGRKAIVSDRPGTTRDRHFGTAEWNGRTFWLVDTGGLVPHSDEPMDVAIRRQVEFALAEADLIVFVVDGKEGVHPIDEAIAAQLRVVGRPVLLAVNKLDDLTRQSADHLPFWELGTWEPLGVSAAVGRQTGDLLDAIVATFPAAEAGEGEEMINVAIIGLPNVGKSSLANKLLGEDRLVVSPVAGTTRDAIDSPLRYHGKTLNFIDTAGLRRRAKVEDEIEFYSTLRTDRAIERAQVCLLVVDAKDGLHTQDLRIATAAWDAGTGLIIVVNKWDLIEEKDSNTAHRGEVELIEKAPFLADVPFIYTSAITGQRVQKVLDLIFEVAAEREKRITTSKVNEVLEQLLQKQMPPQKMGEEIKLLFASQVAVAPPVIAIISNRPDDVPVSYKRYLDRGFREAWGFKGVPLQIKFGSRGSKQLAKDKGDGRR